MNDWMNEEYMITKENTMQMHGCSLEAKQFSFEDSYIKISPPYY